MGFLGGGIVRGVWDIVSSPRLYVVYFMHIPKLSDYEAKLI